MPVPVPFQNKPIAHPVRKHNRSNDKLYSSDLQNLAHSLPVSPAGPPPSFGTREQWINSLPSWRRAKPRRIWEDEVPGQRNFLKGLTVAEDAAVIEGERAQACIPPLGVLLQSLGVPSQTATNMPAFTFGVADEGLVGNGCGRFVSHAMDEDPVDVSVKVRSAAYCVDGHPLVKHGKLADSPMSDDSPAEREDGSSPLEPITPFSQFVDHAVSTPTIYPYGGIPTGTIVQDSYSDVNRFMPCVRMRDPGMALQIPKEPVPAPVAAMEVVTPSASPSYRKLAEPLAEWVVSYVWRVCTTGFSLPQKFSLASPSSIQVSCQPPSDLAASVHSVLLSTLLQPSAVFLAVWYIVHLPVYFDAIGLDTEGTRESAFRAALFSSQPTGFGLESYQSSVPFRMIVLGCMLANKWLDDHTFSNKTWHTISNVPISTLNTLESLALAIFSYDLSVPSREWNRWLSHILTYHASLSSPGRPQPISRPSTNPHSIVRKAIEEIVAAASVLDPGFSQPVFIGLEARRKEKMDRDLILDIDLDEDGPLREEYLPKRRSGCAPVAHYEQPASQMSTLYSESHARSSIVPSPSRWSPSSGEPIVREGSTTGAHYVAVQPALAPTIPAYHQLHSLYQPFPYISPWIGYSVGGEPSYPYPSLPVTYHQHLNPVNPYPPAFHPSHSRSQSVSIDQDQTRNHLRSHSQSHFDYRWSNNRMTTSDAVLPHRDMSWGSTQALYDYPPQTYAPHVSAQLTWPRT